MIASFEQIQSIVKKNPNKTVIDQGRKMSEKLMLHLHGVGMDKAIKNCDYFASPAIYKIQKEYAVSNVDLFARLLQQEDMVFTARGGSTNFKLTASEENQLNAILDNIEYGMNLRTWIKTFALQAYRSDPMGIIFMEIDQAAVDNTGSFIEPRTYPTYKSIFSVFDYQSSGRKLEYVCFKLSVGEALAFGVTDELIKDLAPDKESNYFRFVDDAKDLIVVFRENEVRLVTEITQKNPIANIWKKTPAFIISDLIKFNEPRIFFSPLSPVVELAETFLQDRSIRDLQKKYHGFAKPIEPLLSCGTCLGNKVVNGKDCPDCTPPGGEPTGYKLKTKVSDVARFPLEILEKGNFDFKRIFGYVTPDIDSWEKQDTSLEDIEELVEMTYWGTVRMKRPTPGKSGEAITATESVSNDAPKEARLNSLADWAEKTETMVANFIGQYWLGDRFKTASIGYGRDYVLKTPEELMEAYQTMRTKGAPDFSLDEALEKYYQAKYQNNPTQLAKFLKMLNVEPFPHLSIINAKAVITDFNDYNAKLYFGEWSDTVPDIKWISVPADSLIKDLKTYVLAKGIKEPAPEPIPA